jgi:DNA recombination protein RmuC
MELFLLLLVVVLIGGIVYLLSRQPVASDSSREQQFEQRFGQNMQTLFQQMNAMSTRLDSRLKESTHVNERAHKNVGARLDNAAKVINDVTNKLSMLEESNKRIYDVGKDISTLQDILRAPKLRGNLGEFFLGDLLSQIFPKDNYTLQYKFKTGAMVDAVIHLRDNYLVPVDAKFPLENFKRVLDSHDEEAEKKARKVFANDVKKHIDDIADKYILPDEGTFDFALMYVPAENVYYEVIVKDQEDKSISQYALSKKVIPVSPNSFYIYLQAILLGLRGLQIEKDAKDILSTLGRLKTDFERFGKDFDLVGTHLGRAQSSFVNSEKRLSRFQDKLDSVEYASSPVKKLK